MIRRTIKYIRASEQSEAQNFEHETCDQLYEHLQGLGYYWDNNCQSWIYSPAEENDPPSTTIKIRLWFDKHQVNDVSNKLIELMESDGYRLIEKSTLYPCRPPQANDARIYLRFDSK